MNAEEHTLGSRIAASSTAVAEVDEGALDGHCRVSASQPRACVFVRTISKSPVGEVLRRELRAGAYQTV